MNKLILGAFFVPTVITMGQVPAIEYNKAARIQEKCLAVTIYGEARGESEAGQIAVAYTLINRAKKKSICQVALAPKQYSVFNDNPKLKAAATNLHILPYYKNSIDQKSWERAVKIARLVMNRSVKDPTNGATHYLAPVLMKAKKYRYPKWSKQYTVVSVIDGHKFYKVS